jgi:hypothetical protein
MPAVDPISAIVQTGLGLAQSVVGLINAGKAKREARELEKSRPQYQISPLAGDELSLTKSELSSGGLSSTGQTAYNDLDNQQFSSSLESLLRGGGSVNNVADVYGQGQTGRLRLAQLNDQMRLQKINNYIGSARYYTEQTDKQFDFNKVRPWMDKAQATGQARQKADAGIWAGLGTAGAGVINYSTQKNAQDQFDQYLKTWQGGGTNSTGSNTNQIYDRGLNDYYEPDLIDTGGRPTPRSTNMFGG